MNLLRFVQLLMHFFPELPLFLAVLNCLVLELHSFLEYFERVVEKLVELVWEFKLHPRQVLISKGKQFTIRESLYSEDPHCFTFDSWLFVHVNYLK